MLTGSFKNILYFEGVLFLLLGIIAIAVPQFFTIGVELLVGVLFFVAGIVQCIRLIQGNNQAPGFWPTLFSAIVNLIIGGLLLFYPLAGVITLTLLLIIYFLLDGLYKLYLSFYLKPMSSWGWVLVSGILSLVIAGIIFFGLPGTAVWALGLLVGINMLFFGISLLGIGMNLPKEG